MLTVQKLFLLVFGIFAFYKLTVSLPFIPDELLGLPFNRWVKVLSALLFSTGALWIYLKKK